MFNIDWLILAYAGIFLSGVGVLIVCVSAAKTLSAARKSLRDFTSLADEGLTLAADLTDTVKKVEKQVEPILAETTTLLKHTNVLAEDLQYKSKKLNPLFDSTESLVNSVNNLQGSVTNMKENVENFKKGTDEKINNLATKGKENVEKANGLLARFLKKDNIEE